MSSASDQPGEITQLLQRWSGGDQSALDAAVHDGTASGSLIVTAGAPDGSRARVLRWTARLLAAGLIACGVIVAIAGLLDV